MTLVFILVKFLVYVLVTMAACYWAMSKMTERNTHALIRIVVLLAIIYGAVWVSTPIVFGE